MKAKILPSQESLRGLFAYDAKDGVLIWSERPRSHFKTDGAWRMWNKRYADKVAGCLRVQQDGSTRWYIRLGQARFIRSRLIWKMHNGTDPIEIDHINRNMLDDRIENLREATRSQNCWNTVHKTNSPFRGVARAPGGKWQANIKAHGVAHYLGVFSTPIEAYAAYRAKATELHGDFANAPEVSAR